MTSSAHETAELVARRGYGVLLAYLVAHTRDAAAAEDALSDAFAAALTNWPTRGCPVNPEAWLLAVARRKAVDAIRKRQTGERLAASLQVLTAAPEYAPIPDERLAMLFTCAHPALDAAIRAPLMLQLVLGLDARAIAAAMLTSPSAMSKRLVRAKEKIREAGIPFRVPERGELPARLKSVLDAIYAAFSEGWSDPAATDPVQRDLIREALFLARLITELLPDQPEALGLLALMLHAEARRPARRGADNEYIPLDRQDPRLWDAAQIQEAESLIRRAGAFRQIGRYQLEAALQSAHVYRCHTGEDNWAEIVRIYDALLTISDSPVVALNRAIAICEVQGPAASLAILDQLARDSRLTSYQPYWAARARLLALTGNRPAAIEAYHHAIELAPDPAVERFLADALTPLLTEPRR